MRLSANHIYPVTDFRKRINKYLDELKDEPIVLTLGGKGAAVVMSPVLYEQLVRDREFIAGIDEALQQVKNSDVIAHEDFVEEMEAHFDARAKSR